MKGLLSPSSILQGLLGSFRHWLLLNATLEDTASFTFMFQKSLARLR
jgi:Rad3-related DNA helicase